MGIEFKYPYLLVLLIPAALFIYLYVRQTAKTNRQGAYVIAMIRTLVFVLLISALATPQLLLPLKGENVVFVTDRSASVKDADSVSLGWIEEAVTKKGAEDTHAIAAFGGDIALEQNRSADSSSISQYNGKLNMAETNLEGALTFASSMIPNKSGGRIVVFSDGNETIGQSNDVIRLLNNRGIEIDYMPLPSVTGEDLALSDVSLSPSIYLGEEVPITVTIDSNSEKQADIRLSVNNQEVIQETVDVKEGTNMYSFRYQAAEGGMNVFKAEVSAAGDTFTENNVMHAISTVQSAPKLLIVQNEESSQLPSVFEDSGLETDVLTPEKLPTTLSGYLSYQSILFNNVAATSITEQQMTLIEQAVREFGVGFVMAGGDESFGLGGYFKTPIEKLLPVDMDIKGKKEMPSLGLIIVLDRSGSMSGNKLELAKEAAARSVELLREEDTLGFIAFDDRPWEIVETAPLKDKEEAVEKIRSVTPGGGTEIYSSLEMAYEELEDLKLQRKHIILLTDGQSATNNDYDSLIEEGKEGNITLSTVALGGDADRALLEELASSGSGRFYDVTDSSVIPSILSRETVMATRTYIEDQPFYPLLQPYPEWQGLLADGVPQMNAYIATTPKDRAQVPLLSEKEDPVLAQWRYGMGQSIAFTSDLSGKWSGDWARWEKWPQFLNEMVTKTLPQFDSEPFSIRVDKTAENTVLTVESHSSQTLPIEAAIISEDGEEVDASTNIVAPGEYEIIVPESSGMYFLSIAQTDENGQLHAYQTGFTIPYSDEYLIQGTNEETLEKLAEGTGGRKLEQPEEAFRPLAETSYDIQPFSKMLILAAFLLFFCEIAIRRFGWHSLLLKKWANRAKKRDHVQTASLPPRGVPPKKAENKKEEKSAKAEVNAQPQSAKTSKTKKPKSKPLTPEERAEKMNRLLDAKNRKNK
ncbi:VWA domain-containing protein [Cytobacillus gottheilii]|uniref:VWA domain-containing protein n=1 Tax=Cytobacillus gottheilii TaxID=859144 RepID=UPI0009BA8093|nr:VWA domain-containing protein [Cytobacillus gottheilii]